MFIKTLRGFALATGPVVMLLGASPTSAQLENLNAFCIDLFGSNHPDVLCNN